MSIAISAKERLSMARFTPRLS